MNHLNQKDLIKLCVLHLINKKDYESYHLVKKLNDVFKFKINYIYPIIYRFINEGYIETYDVEENGNKDKYYILSARGKEYYQQTYDEWLYFQDKFNNLVIEEDDYE